jgi:hypothetical protein
MGRSRLRYLTYSLGAKQVRKGSNDNFAEKEPDHLHTEERNNAPKWLDKVLAEMDLNHVLPNEVEKPLEGQTRASQRRNENTYSLRIEQGHETVKRRFRSEGTTSRTYLGEK